VRAAKGLFSEGTDRIAVFQSHNSLVIALAITGKTVIFGSFQTISNAACIKPLIVNLKRLVKQQ
jgi:hypothetical protein